MAVTQGKSPIIMTAVGDEIPYRVKISVIRAVAGNTAGNFTLIDIVSGQIVWQHLLLPVDEVDESHFPTNKGWYDSIRLTEVPANGKLFIYYE